MKTTQKNTNSLHPISIWDHLQSALFLPMIKKTRVGTVKCWYEKAQLYEINDLTLSPSQFRMH